MAPYQFFNEVIPYAIAAVFLGTIYLWYRSFIHGIMAQRKKIENKENKLKWF